MDTDKGLARARPAPRVEQRAAAPPEYTVFFHDHYRELVRAAMYMGASRDEADEAAATTMQEVLRRWRRIDDPLAYARRAVVSNFLKEKTRGLGRLRRRMVERAAYTPAGREDQDLNAWEGRQWVMQKLQSLPASQREVMARIVDGYSPVEIATLLGKTPEAVRQCLCAARERLKHQFWRDEQDPQGLDRPAGAPRKEAR